MVAHRCLFLILWFLFSVALATEIEPDMVLEIPMRDGTRLPTDIYLPYPDAKGLPCVLVRTPSGRRCYYKEYQPLSEAGYVVAIQDSRSGCDKEGKTFPYVHDGWGDVQDGYDAVEWLAKHCLTNGKVGTMGFSAMGITQLLMAPSCPPSLVAQHIGFAVPDLYEYAIFHGGQLHKNQVEGWLGYHAKDPLVLNQILKSDACHPLWSQMNMLQLVEKVKTPALHYGGWYDTFSQGTIDAFLAIQKEGSDGARGKQKLVMGPWTHHWPRHTILGDFDVPEAGKKPPHDVSPKEWFDYYLKGIDTGIVKIPAVTYYVMGPYDGTSSKGNVWKTREDWPPPSKATSYFLASSQQLLKQKGEVGANTFTYDPENPTPTIGGKNLFLESGPKDQRPIEERDDVVVFTTPPLEEDTEVTGRVGAKIYFTTDRKDTDVVVRLTDVYPDGRSILIGDGIRKLSTVKKPLPGDPYEVDVDLLSTSQVFAKGHRIRISITSSNYPRYEKNLNNPDGKTPLKAQNTIHFGGKTPSQLILPVVL